MKPNFGKVSCNIEITCFLRYNNWNEDFVDVHVHVHVQKQTISYPLLTYLMYTRLM